MVDFRYDDSQATLIAHFAGRMSAEMCAQLVETMRTEVRGLSQLAGATDPKVVMDLQDVDYVSSAFLRVVLVTARLVGQGNLVVINPNQFIQDLFDTTGLGHLIVGASVRHETGVFPPPADFAARARLSSLEEYQALHRASIEDPEAFWGQQAQEHLLWFEPWHTVLEWDLPDARWFSGGQLNACHNCLDRHLGTPVADKAAIIWEGEPVAEDASGEIHGTDRRVLTYRELHREVCTFANVLKREGVGKGDRVIIYLPMVPEAAIAMLACARLGALHSVVFGGFSAQAVAERIQDCDAKLVITADGGHRRGAVVPLKLNVDAALACGSSRADTDDEGKPADRRDPTCTSVERVIVLRRTGHEIAMQEGRDVWWHEATAEVDADCPAEPVGSEHPLFILYTSGSTGKPKGIVHSTAGYLLGAKLSHQWIFDLQPEDIFWCTADIGWITGHSYVVYGPLANGATVFMYEGAPNFPEPDRFWRLIQEHGVTIFYTAPTAIRAFMQWGDHWVRDHDLSSLRLLGSVGEPINPEAWLWYHETIGGGRCPIVDTWWQTETGSIMIAPLPGAVPTKPGSATLPFFGVLPEVVDEQGRPVPPNANGTLVIRRPWPSMLRGVWGDRERFHLTYWADIPGSYCTGDGVRQDEDGYFWIIGRLDDVLNIAGHRIGTAEVESALVGHPAVAEAAVVGRADDIKGFVVVAFVTLISGQEPNAELREALRQQVSKEVGSFVKPEEIRFAQALPKTRSGKIMRRLLKQVAAGTEITGDTTTLEDFNVLARLGAEGSDEG